MVAHQGFATELEKNTFVSGLGIGRLRHEDPLLCVWLDAWQDKLLRLVSDILLEKRGISDTSPPREPDYSS
jgi:hypothetical protein